MSSYAPSSPCHAGQIYTLAEALTLPIPPPNAPISTGQATPRSEPMHPTGVTDDPRIAQDILDFCNQFVDPFEGEALYPTSVLGPGSVSLLEHRSLSHCQSPVAWHLNCE